MPLFSSGISVSSFEVLTEIGWEEEAPRLDMARSEGSSGEPGAVLAEVVAAVPQQGLERWRAVTLDSVTAAVGALSREGLRALTQTGSEEAVVALRKPEEEEGEDDLEGPHASETTTTRVSLLGLVGKEERWEAGGVGYGCI